MKAISDLIQEIKNCELAGATMAAVTLCYVCIDTMAFLSMPESQDNTTKTDFIGWVDAHLKSHPNQPYEYRGVDVYAARCAVLHTWGAEAAAHRKDPTIRQFGYTDGELHYYAPDVSDRLVLIGVPSLINDLVIGVESFLTAAKNDANLRERLNSRIEKVMQTFPFPQIQSGAGQ